MKYFDDDDVNSCYILQRKSILVMPPNVFMTRTNVNKQLTLEMQIDDIIIDFYENYFWTRLLSDFSLSI